MEEIEDGLVQGQMGGVEDGAVPAQLAVAADAVQVVGEGETVALGHFQDLVVAVAVEGRPGDGGRGIIPGGVGAPVESDRLVVVADLESAALVAQG